MCSECFLFMATMIFFSTYLNVCWTDNITAQYLFSYRLDAVLKPSWAIIFTNAVNIVNSNLGNKLKWNQPNSYIFIQENSFENIVWKIADILSRPQCADKQRQSRNNYLKKKLEIGFGWNFDRNEFLKKYWQMCAWTCFCSYWPFIVSINVIL